MHLMANRTRIRLALALVAGALAFGTASGAAAAASDTPCGPAPNGYNIIISNETTIRGTDGPDFICAGNGKNQVWAGDGDDVVHGRGGADSIHGEDGDDVILGGPGADSLFGEKGDDRLNGGANHDWLNGGTGNDVLHGRKGNDHLDGGVGNDRIRGGLGRDVLLGRNGNDILQGNAGPDLLWGGHDRDRLDGRRGTDYCFPAARMVSCENNAPSGTGLAFYQLLDTPALYTWRASVGSISEPSDPDEVWQTVYPHRVLAILWRDDTRTEAIDWRQGSSDPVSGSWAVEFPEAPLGAVVDAFDIATGRGATLTYRAEAAITLDDPRGPGVVVTAPAASTVTLVDSDAALRGETTRTLFAEPTGGYYFRVPGLGTYQHKLEVVTVDDVGNETTLELTPARNPMFRVSIGLDHSRTQVRSHGGWTPNSTVEISINDEVHSTAPTDLNGHFWVLDLERVDQLLADQPVEFSITDLATGLTKSTMVVFDVDPTTWLDADTVRITGHVASNTVATRTVGYDHELGYEHQRLPIVDNGAFSFDRPHGINTGLTIYDDDGDSYTVFVLCDSPGSCKPG